MFNPEIEPIIPSDSAISNSDLPALAITLERKASALGGALPPQTAELITGVLRTINSYYSNLIEGHDTHPVDIRRALHGDYAQDKKKRDLQQESIAHIEVQKLIDQTILSSDTVATGGYICWIHKEFYERSPKEFRTLEDGSIMKPGHYRKCNVTIGQHLAPPPEDIERLIARFEHAFMANRIRNNPIIATMAAHHRLLWIHPFADGNGRVGRLFTDVMLKAHGVGGIGIWCLSRGLARSIKRTDGGYKAFMARADQPRKGDTDGRGTLTESGFIDFIRFMIETAIDQVNYMQEITKPQSARARIDRYIRARNDGLIMGCPPINPVAARLLKFAYTEGTIPRSEMEELTGYKSSAARKLVQQMKAEGLLTETTHRAPLMLGIPEHFEPYLLPGLAPQL